MALKMPGPTIRPIGVYQRNVRVPADLLKVVVGMPISLPMGAEFAVPRARYTIAYSALLSHSRLFAVARLRRRAMLSSALMPSLHPVPRHLPARNLTHKQIVALAGDVYPEYFDRHEKAFDLAGIARADALHERSVRAWMAGDADNIPIPLDDAEFLAVLSEPMGAQYLAWQRRGDIVIPGRQEPMTFESALEDLFGVHADRVCAKQRFRLHAETRLKLLTHIADTVELGAGRLGRVDAGDYSTDANLARFPNLMRRRR